MSHRVSAGSVFSYATALLALVVLPAGTAIADDDPSSHAPGTYGRFELGVNTALWVYTPELSAFRPGVRDRDSISDTLTSVGVDASVSFPSRWGEYVVGGMFGGYADGDWGGRLNLDGFNVNIDGSMNSYGALYGGIRGPVYQCPGGHTVSLGFRAGGGFVDYDMTATTEFTGLRAQFGNQNQNQNFNFGNQNQNFGNQNQNFGNRNRFDFGDTVGMGFAELSLRLDMPRFSVSAGAGIIAVEGSSFITDSAIGPIGFHVEDDVGATGFLNFSIPFLGPGESPGPHYHGDL